MHKLLPPLDLGTFSSDYQSARREFLQRFAALPALGLVEHVHHRHPEPGPDGKPLYADWLLLSKTDHPSKLLVLISGTHGVEGFVGSAIQCDLLGNGVAELLEDESLAVLFIHALNPWGFAWLRRCDHEGIDLNRNFVDFKGGLPNNGAYATMHRLLSQPAASVLNGHAPLSLDAITRGQYQYPQGLYFGGHGPSWSRQWLDSRKNSAIFTKLRNIAVIDLHSGLGPFGYGEVISDHPRQTPGFELARNWYGANTMSSELGESISAPKTGLMDLFWHKLLGERGCFVTLEFGTYSDREMIDVLIDEQRYFRLCRDTNAARDLSDPERFGIAGFFLPRRAELARSFSTSRTPNYRYGAKWIKSLVSVAIRAGTRFDIDALLSLENNSFTTDRISRRSFMRFVSKGAHSLLVAENAGNLLGYVLVLFRSGTSLARIYSIAVSDAARGQGVASKLLTHAELIASKRYCLFIRLEVHTENTAALALYNKFGYKSFTRLKQYYEDGGDAEQLEKRLLPSPPSTAPAPYYQQTTEFTCGPASLMMAMQALTKGYQPSTREELQIWREATTIFMTAGHGGCSPHGLAVSAHHRGYKPVLYINTDKTPFLDSVRGEDKKRVITLVHEAFEQQIKNANIDVRLQNLSAPEIKEILSLNLPVVALISTWMLNRSKAPHWVFVSNANEDFVYINDPYLPDAPWQADDYRRAPIPVENFVRMASFGRRKLRALLVLDTLPHDKQENQ